MKEMFVNVTKNKRHGHKQTPDTCRKIRISKLGSKNPRWVGDKITYKALHVWINRNLTKSKKCQNCHKVKKLEAVNISGKYLRNFLDWKWLCRKCHMTEDGRLIKLIERNKNGNNRGRTYRKHD